MIHQCGDRELRAARMLLALMSDDRDNYELVIREIAGCSRCWEDLSHWLIGLVAGDRIRAAGGVEEAAGYVLADLEHYLPE
jgi:hypothetical protein